MAVSTELAKTTPTALASAGAQIDQLLVLGDLSKLTPEQKATYYMTVCRSLGLNPYTKPFGYISLNGALQLYAKKDATEQLRKAQDVSIDLVDKRFDEQLGLYIVTARAYNSAGRRDEATGAVSILDPKGNLIKGEAMANAIMKCETKAKRRVTLSFCGLSFLDETEIEGAGASIEPEDVSLPSPPPVMPPAGTDALAQLSAERQTPPSPPSAASEVDDSARRAYWALHNEMGLPPHEGENKKLNYAVWWKILGRVYENGKQIPEIHWVQLRKYLYRLRGVDADGVKTAPYKMPQAWAMWMARDTQAPGGGAEMPALDEYDAFADE